MSEYGTKELGEALDFVCELLIFTDKAGEDGYGAEDIGLAVPALLKLPAALEGISDVPSEALDLDAAEIADLSAKVDAKLGEGVFSAMGERLIAAALHVAGAIHVWKKQPKA